MTLPELTEIIRTADERTIASELKRLGYIDCEKDKRYKHISLVDLFKGKHTDTEEYADKKGKLTYQGAIFTEVNGYENSEFIIVNINKNDGNEDSFPVKLRFFVKEMTR